MEYQLEEIESVEQLEDFNNEYVYDIEVDDDSHTFIANDILVHNSVYTTFGTFFEAMTPESQAKYNTDDKKLKWILKYSKEFQDKLNNKWCDEMYNPRHGQNIHEFELETVSKSGIYLKKKKYLKGLVFNKGKYLDHPKVSGTGIELIKSTTPKLCRVILKDLIKRRVAPGALHFTCSEVYRTRHGRVYTAEIKNQLPINIKPEVIVTGEFKDNIMSPGIQAVCSLCKAGLHFHSKEIVCFILAYQV